MHLIFYMFFLYETVIDWLFILIFMNRLPFDWKHPISYLVAFIIVFVCAFCILMICLSILTYAVSACCMLLAFIKDLKQEVNSINVIGKGESSHFKLKEKIFEIVEFHATVKELSFNFNDPFHMIKYRVVLYFYTVNCLICKQVDILYSHSYPLSYPKINIFFLLILFFKFRLQIDGNLWIYFVGLFHMEQPNNLQYPFNGSIWIG